MQGIDIANIRAIFLAQNPGTGETTGDQLRATPLPQELPLLMGRRNDFQDPLSFTVTDLFDRRPTAQEGQPTFGFRTTIYQENQPLGKLNIGLNPEVELQIGQCREADLPKMPFWSQLEKKPYISPMGRRPCLVIQNGERIVIILSMENNSCLVHAANLGSKQTKTESIGTENWQLGINFDLTGDDPPYVAPYVPKK